MLKRVIGQPQSYSMCCCIARCVLVLCLQKLYQRSIFCNIICNIVARLAAQAHNSTMRLDANLRNLARGAAIEIV